MSFLLLTTLLIALLTTAKSEQDGIRSVLPNGDYRKTFFSIHLNLQRFSKGALRVKLLKTDFRASARMGNGRTFIPRRKSNHALNFQMSKIFPPFFFFLILFGCFTLFHFSDGELVCTTNFKNRASLPKGKYINTCTNCTFIDDVLKCQCKTDDDKV